MSAFVPESKQLGKRSTSSGWDAHKVCKTLILWYPELLRHGEIHPDMRDPHSALDLLNSFQDYPADLQDIMLMLAQHHGITKAAQALENAISKTTERRQRNRRATHRGGRRSDDADRLTA